MIEITGFCIAFFLHLPEIIKFVQDR